MIEQLPYIDSYLQWSFLDISGTQFVLATILFFGLVLLLWVFKIYGLWVLSRIAAKTPTELDGLLINALKSVKWPFYVLLALFIALSTLALPEQLSFVVTAGLYVVILYYVLKMVSVVIDVIALKYVKKREQADEGTSVILVLSRIAKASAFLLALLLLLQNIGVEITPLLAGVGIGGLAIAFALQNIFEDLFASFSIYFDKPFKKGDFLVIGDDMGVVEYIGMKSTRLRTLQGQELIVSNRDLTNTRINNYKRMERRRIVFGFGLEYGTPVAGLKRANELVKQVFSEVEDADLDRSHFKEFADSSLDFEVVYYLNTSDYTAYMDTQQQINLRIKELFDQEGLSMAFPTQTVHINKNV